MIEWKEYKLGDAPFEIIDGDRGTNYPKQDEFSQNEYCLFLNAKNVTIDGFAFDECYFISKYKDEKLRKGKLRRNDVVLTTRGTVGNVGFYDARIQYENIRINSGMVIIRPDCKGISPEYTHQLFKFLKSDFDVFATGSAQPQLPIRDLKEVSFLLPSLPEQHAIANVLSSLDDKIDLLHRQNKTLEGMAETLWRKMFVEEANENWETTVFSNHVEALRGLSYKGNGLAEECTGIPMHNLNSVHEGGGYKYEGIKYYSGDYKDRHVVKPGEIIVTNTEQGHQFRLIGFPAIVPHYFGEAGIFSQHIYKLKILEKTYLTSQFLYYLIMTPKVREQIIGATNGSTVNMLAIDGLQRPEFSLPPEGKVMQFSETAKLFWQRQEDNKTQIRTLSRLRDSLLPKLMSGEVRVKV